MPARPGNPTDARSGVLVVDKPAGLTSHEVVSAVRRRIGGGKVGHTGTLDPFATGVLPLVVGKATRLAQHLSGVEKEYEAVVRVGRATDTHDVTGRVTFEAPAGAGPGLDPEEMRRLLMTFRGTWLQTPPAFSAKHADGARAYEHARRGVAVALEPVEVTVRELELLSVEDTLVTVRLACTAGFYVRAFAHEFGQRLGSGACLERLRRTRSGSFGLDQAVPLRQLLEEDPLGPLVPLEGLLADWAAVVLTQEGVEWVRHGREVGPAQWRGTPVPGAAGQIRLMTEGGALVALAVPEAGGLLRPAVVLV